MGYFRNECSLKKYQLGNLVNQFKTYTLSNIMFGKLEIMVVITALIYDESYKFGTYVGIQNLVNII